MKKSEILKLALSNIDFSIHEKHMEKCVEENRESSCIIFAVDGIVYGRGFDGVDLIFKKQTPERSQILINRGNVLIIR